jgi:hypothetical protein
MAMIGAGVADENGDNASPLGVQDHGSFRPAKKVKPEGHLRAQHDNGFEATDLFSCEGLYRLRL